MKFYQCIRQLLILGLLLTGTALWAADSDIVSEVVAVRSPGEDGVAVYRIPGLARTKAGTLIAVFDLRRDNANDVPANIDVGSSRSTDGGKTWEPTRVVFDFHAEDEAMEGVGDPSILVDETTGRIWVAAVWGHNGRGIDQSLPGLAMGTSAQFVLACSDDDGLTWSEPVNITPQFAEAGKTWRSVYQGPGSGITTKDGVLVFPAQYWDQNGVAFSTIITSRDHGETWTIGTGAYPMTSEPQVAELADGRLMLNLRNECSHLQILPPEIQEKYQYRFGTAEKKRVVCVTDDFGQTWTEHATSQTALPEPVCQASIIRVASKAAGDEKDVLAFFNPKSFTARDTMTLQLSDDDGQTWTRSILVDPASCYGYSSMAMVDSERIGILYESIGGLLFRTVRWRDVP